MDIVQNSKRFKALGHPTRLGILKLLLIGHCNVSGLSEKLGVAQSTISQHLTLLRREGIIQGKRDKEGTCYHIDDEVVLKLLSVID